MKSYALEGLDLAHAIRAAVTTPTPSAAVNNALSGLVGRFTTLCEQEARLLAQSSKSGRVCVEDEIQALIVATLRSDPLLWKQNTRCAACYGAAGIRRVCPSCQGFEQVSWGVVAVHHSPLGGSRSEREGALLKRAGARAGWPDLDVRFVDTNEKRRSALLELKAPGGRARKAQKDTLALLVGAGFEAEAVVKLSEVVSTLVRLLRGDVIGG